jgi:N-acetyl-gamma-glutamyl-phosphate reductase
MTQHDAPAFTAAILGASGYAGGELIRLIDGHPRLTASHLGAYSQAGSTLGDVHPHLSGGERTLGTLDPAEVPEVDVVFLALPHGASAGPAMALASRGIRVIDLGSDFRLDSPDRYREAYGAEHPFPGELGKWVYGLPELFGDAIANAQRIAAPGCYPTSAILALAPLLAGGLIEPSGIVVDSLSGTSGAGRSVKPHLTFGAVDEGVVAYGLLKHRHRPEMEQGLGRATGVEPTIVFTPHLVPMHRGILSTCYAEAAPYTDVAAVTEALDGAYAGAPFVDIVSEPPQTRAVVGSNRCVIAPFVDPRTRRVIVLAAEDNLLKGAAGQAVQCANLMFGLDETLGLPLAGWMP